MGAPGNRMLDFDLNELPPDVKDELHPMEAESELCGAALEREAASTLASWAMRHHAKMAEKATAPARSTQVIRSIPLQPRAPFDSSSSCSSTMTMKGVSSVGAIPWSSNASQIPINGREPILYSFLGSAVAGKAPLQTANGCTGCANCRLSRTPCTQNVEQNDPPSPVSGSEHMVGSTSDQGRPGPIQSGMASSQFSHVGHVAQASEEVNQQSLERKERAFLNAFPFNTQRCEPWAPCTRCLAFFKVPIPYELAVDSMIGMHFPGATYFSHMSAHGVPDRPPVFRTFTKAAPAERSWRSFAPRPRRKTSVYRGVSKYRDTGRWEAVVWKRVRGQISLGASTTQEEAAANHDKAAIMLRGPGSITNFNPKYYQVEMAYLYKLNLEQLVIYLRRDSRGYGAEATYLGVSMDKNTGAYDAQLDGRFLGTYGIEEDAARAVFKEALRCGDYQLACWIINTHHVRNTPSYAMRRLLALNPDAAMKQLMDTTARKNSPGKRKSQATMN